jgi:hypothetical protein
MQDAIANCRLAFQGAELARNAENGRLNEVEHEEYES